MKVLCPICNVEGSAQIRGLSVRVGHYRGYKGETRIVEWHATTLEAIKNMVNKHGKQTVNMVNNSLKSSLESLKDCRGSLVWKWRQTHNLESV